MTGGNFNVFQRTLTVSLHSPNGRHPACHWGCARRLLNSLVWDAYCYYISICTTRWLQAMPNGITINTTLHATIETLKFISSANGQMFPFKWHWDICHVDSSIIFFFDTGSTFDVQNCFGQIWIHYIPIIVHRTLLCLVLFVFIYLVLCVGLRGYYLVS